MCDSDSDMTVFRLIKSEGMNGVNAYVYEVILFLIRVNHCFAQSCGLAVKPTLKGGLLTTLDSEQHNPQSTYGQLIEIVVFNVVLLLCPIFTLPH